MEGIIRSCRKGLSSSLLPLPAGFVRCKDSYPCPLAPSPASSARSSGAPVRPAASCRSSCRPGFGQRGSPSEGSASVPLSCAWVEKDLLIELLFEIEGILVLAGCAHLNKIITVGNIEEPSSKLWLMSNNQNKVHLSRSLVTRALLRGCSLVLSFMKLRILAEFSLDIPGTILDISAILLRIISDFWGKGRWHFFSYCSRKSLNSLMACSLVTGFSRSQSVVRYSSCCWQSREGVEVVVLGASRWRGRQMKTTVRASETQLMMRLKLEAQFWKFMKQSCPIEKASREHFRMKASMELTELEWKLGLLNLQSSLYLLTQNISTRPTGAKAPIMGCRARKKPVKQAVFITQAYQQPSSNQQQEKIRFSSCCPSNCSSLFWGSRQQYCRSRRMMLQGSRSLPRGSIMLMREMKKTLVTSPPYSQMGIEPRLARTTGTPIQFII